jgi:hypothetical protein
MSDKKINYNIKYIPYHQSRENSHLDLPKMTLRFSRELRIFFKENHDYCTSCLKHFKPHELTHLGFDFLDKFIYACNSCSKNVKETVVRYGYSFRDYAIPPNNASLWRYMDFTKYVSLLHTKSLFFSSASLFNDPFEGAKGTIENKSVYDDAYISMLADAIADKPDVKELIPPNEDDFAKAKELHEQMAKAKMGQRNYTFLSCWHENEFESDGMWYLYSKDISNAIAVRTTYERLYLALDKDPEIDIGRVNYMDFSKEFTKTNSEYWYKRNSFSHEREVRAINVDRNKDGKVGIYKPVNLELLIDKIFISPKANEWFVDLVIDINSKYGIEKEISHSDLSKKPFY